MFKWFGVDCVCVRVQASHNGFCQSIISMLITNLGVQNKAVSDWKIIEEFLLYIK